MEAPKPPVNKPSAKLKLAALLRLEGFNEASYLHRVVVFCFRFKNRGRRGKKASIRTGVLVLPVICVQHGLKRHLACKHLYPLDLQSIQKRMGMLKVKAFL